MSGRCLVFRTGLDVVFVVVVWCVDRVFFWVGKLPISSPVRRVVRDKPVCVGSVRKSQAEVHNGLRGISKGGGGVFGQFGQISIGLTHGG